MALVFADRVQETTTTGFAGTGDVQLNGVPTSPLGRVTFADGVGDGNSCKFLIDDAQGNWEISEGALTSTGSPHTLTRERVIASSASGSKVNFLAGSKDVTLVATSEDVGGLPHGQCRLTLDGSNLTLSRYGGVGLTIDGVGRSVPSGGVTLSSNGLTADTTYYVYAAMTGATMTLEASTTGHATHSDGVEIKTGDSSRTLVGLVRTGSSGQFLDSSTQRQVISYFNREMKAILSEAIGTVSTTSTSFIEVTHSLRIGLVCWEGQVDARYSYTASNGVGNGVTEGALCEDPTGSLTVIGHKCIFRGELNSNNVASNQVSNLEQSLAEGFHLLSSVIRAGTGGSGDLAHHGTELGITGFVWG